MQTIDRNAAKLLRDDVDAALRAVAAKHGIEYGGAGNAAFTGAQVTFKAVVFKLATADRSHFEAYCSLYGLKPEHYGKTFRARDGEYEIVGLELKRHTFPIKARKVGTGAVLLFKAEGVAKQLEKTEK